MTAILAAPIDDTIPDIPLNEPFLGLAAQEEEEGHQTAKHNAYLVLVDGTGTEREKIIHYLDKGGVVDADQRVIQLHKASQLSSAEEIERIANESEVQDIAVVNLSKETEFIKNPLAAIYDNLARFVDRMSNTGARIFLGSKFDSDIQNSLITDKIMGKSILPFDVLGMNLKPINDLENHRGLFEKIAKLINRVGQDFWEAAAELLGAREEIPSFCQVTNHTLFRPGAGDEASQTVEDFLPFIDMIFNIEPS